MTILRIPRNFPSWLFERACQAVFLLAGGSALLGGLALLIWGAFLTMETVP